MKIKSGFKNLNINTMVTFTLTAEGRKVIKIPAYMTKRGLTVTTELWDFVNLFGGKIYMGQQALIEDNILKIDTKELV